MVALGESIALVDGSNIALGGTRVPKLERLLAVKRGLLSAGVARVEVICDASLRHRFRENNPSQSELFQRGLDAGLWFQTPARVTADRVILERMKDDPNCVAVSSDAFGKPEDEPHRPPDLSDRQVRVQFYPDSVQLIYPDLWANAPVTIERFLPVDEELRSVLDSASSAREKASPQTPRTRRGATSSGSDSRPQVGAIPVGREANVTLAASDRRRSSGMARFLLIGVGGAILVTLILVVLSSAGEGGTPESQLDRAGNTENRTGIGGNDDDALSIDQSNTGPTPTPSAAVLCVGNDCKILSDAEADLSTMFKDLRQLRLSVYGAGEVSVFSEPQFQGDCYTFASGSSTGDSAHVGNFVNHPGSLKVGADCPQGAILCQTNAPGQCHRFEGEEAELSSKLPEGYFAHSLELHGIQKVSLYSEVGFQGDCYTFSEDAPSVGGLMDNRGVNSLKVGVDCPQGAVLCQTNSAAYACHRFEADEADISSRLPDSYFSPSLELHGINKVSLFSENDFQGDCFTFSEDSAAVGKSLDNRDARSLKVGVDCPQGAILCQPNAPGQCHRFEADEADISSRLPDSYFSPSLELHGIGSVSLFSGSNFAGECRTFLRDTAAVGFQPRSAQIEVECP